MSAELAGSLARRRIGIFGGSFDPPHRAHQQISRWAVAKCRLDHLWWVPTCVHPRGKPLSAFEHRLAMCQIAVSALGDAIAVSAVEQSLAAELGGQNHSVDTVRALAREHPGAALFWITGADVARRAPRWPGWRALQSLAEVVVVHREVGGDTTPPGSSPPGREAISPGAPIERISSSVIRQRVDEGRSIAALVPEAVRAYIEEHDLYRLEQTPR